MDQQTGVATLFDRLADSYDNVGVDFFRPIAEALVSELGLRAGERVLDVGCGRGAMLASAAAAVGETGRLTAIDLSPRMVEVARAQAARDGLTVDFRVDDAQAPTLPPASYDVVASSLVLFFLPDPLGAVRAWRELLVDGGRVGVSTFGPYTESWQQIDELLAAHLPQRARDARTTGRSGPFGSDDAMEALLREAGFGEVRTATRTIEVRFDDAEHWHRWSLSLGQRQMWEAIPDDRRDEVRRQAYDAVERQRRDDGRIGFDQTVRYTLGRR